jgi:hypothetical protein
VVHVFLVGVLAEGSPWPSAELHALAELLCWGTVFAPQWSQNDNKDLRMVLPRFGSSIAIFLSDQAIVKAGCVPEEEQISSTQSGHTEIPHTRPVESSRLAIKL